MFLIYFSIESTCTTISILLGRIIWRLRYVKDVYYYLFWDTGFNEGKWWHRASFSVKMIGTMVKHGHKFLLLLVSILKEGTCATSIIKYFEYHLCYRQKKKKRERKKLPPPFFFYLLEKPGSGKSRMGCLAQTVLLLTHLEQDAGTDYHLIELSIWSCLFHEGNYQRTSYVGHF